MKLFVPILFAIVWSNGQASPVPNDADLSSTGTYWERIQHRFNISSPFGALTSSNQTFDTYTNANCTLIRDNYANRIIQSLVRPPIASIRTTQWLTEMLGTPIVSAVQRAPMMDSIGRRIANDIQSLNSTLDGWVQNLSWYLPAVKC